FKLYWGPGLSIVPVKPTRVSTQFRSLRYQDTDGALLQSGEYRVLCHDLSALKVVLENRIGIGHPRRSMPEYGWTVHRNSVDIARGG
ncbi:MAG TPA: hypothetical protein VFE96_00365, partial [Candidatus Bathyarchaeia archaeon]|nr:hypothetical protein [Candidatus Bathyarchaeia archaeon]